MLRKESGYTVYFGWPLGLAAHFWEISRRIDAGNPFITLRRCLFKATRSHARLPVSTYFLVSHLKQRLVGSAGACLCRKTRILPFGQECQPGR